MGKTAEIHIYLFGKPEWEFGGEISPETIKSKGDEIRARLYEAADNLKKLSGNGWEHELCLYDIMLAKSTSKAAAEKELAEFGIEEEVFELEEERE